MSARRLEGKPLADRRRIALAQEAEAVAAVVGRRPCLAVVLATADSAALAYAAAKEKTATSLGVDVRVVRIDDARTESLVARVRALAADEGVDGILIETPVAAGIDLRAAQDVIPERKDVDGASAVSLGRLFCGLPGFAPATAAAVMALLDAHEVPLAGARAVVVGRSLVVGRPLAQLLLARDATVTVCHSRTRDLASVTREADIVCAAVGRPRFVGAAMIHPGAVVVDIGTNVVDGRLVGDVDYDAVAAIAGAVSPVPGGVGSLTSVLVLEHTVHAARRRGEARSP